jgi:hypothetical protein
MNNDLWKRRVDTRRNDMAHGITFVMYERKAKNVRSEIAFNGKKALTDGTVSLTLAFDQYKYGDEIIFQLFTREAPQFYDRRADGWTRMQIYGGKADRNTAEMLMNVANDILERLKNSESEPIF